MIIIIIIIITKQIFLQDESLQFDKNCCQCESC